MNKKKTKGFYVALIAGLIGIVSLIQFSMWAPKHNGTDMMITIALVIGILLDIVLFKVDHGLIMVLSTTAYTVAAVRLLTDSVGSFVDAFQGIVMFGDPTQVGTIVRIAVIMFISVVLSIIASFMTRTQEVTEKEE